MFNSDFYPTPKEVTDRMVDDLNLYRSLILEPSAGKLDICHAITSRFTRSADKKYIDCIEKDVSLQAFIRGEGYNLVATDFLEYYPKKQYEMSNIVPIYLKILEIRTYSNSCIVKYF
jgi:hypothetical protein